jgi:sulfonate transport system ATP-binding protein
MHALLRKLCAAHKPAVLLVTHDVDEAIDLADRVILLDAGVVRADVRVDRSPAELRAYLLDELGVNQDETGVRREELGVRKEELGVNEEDRR